MASIVVVATRGWPALLCAVRLHVPASSTGFNVSFRSSTTGVNMRNQRRPPRRCQLHRCIDVRFRSATPGKSMRNQRWALRGRQPGRCIETIIPRGARHRTCASWGVSSRHWLRYIVVRLSDFWDVRCISHFSCSIRERRLALWSAGSRNGRYPCIHVFFS